MGAPVADIGDLLIGFGEGAVEDYMLFGEAPTDLQTADIDAGAERLGP